MTGFAVQGLSAAQGLAIAHWINWWLATLFPWGVVAVILTVLSDVYRIVRLKAAQAKLTHGLAAAL